MKGATLTRFGMVLLLIAAFAPQAAGGESRNCHAQGNMASGAVTGFQLITDPTGELAGATGYLFVAFDRGGTVETTVSREIGFP